MQMQVEKRLGMSVGLNDGMDKVSPVTQLQAEATPVGNSFSRGHEIGSRATPRTHLRVALQRLDDLIILQIFFYAPKGAVWL